jgi:hypothetical protein
MYYEPSWCSLPVSDVTAAYMHTMFMHMHTHTPGIIHNGIKKKERIPALKQG